MNQHSSPTILFLQDGDRRWGKRESVSFETAYLKMAEKIGLLVDSLAKQNIHKLYLPTNSIANLSRPKEQVDAFLSAYLELPKYIKTPTKIVLRGNFDLLPESYKEAYRQLEKSTANQTGFTLNLLLNWSTLDETVRITSKLAAADKAITPEAILQESDIPEPVDLIIRTGIRRRLSSFMPLSGEYAEIVFLDILFPDLVEEDILNILEEYKNRERTHGL